MCAIEDFKPNKDTDKAISDMIELQKVIRLKRRKCPKQYRPYPIAFKCDISFAGYYNYLENNIICLL